MSMSITSGMRELLWKKRPLLAGNQQPGVEWRGPAGGVFMGVSTHCQRFRKLGLKKHVRT